MFEQLDIAIAFVTVMLLLSLLVTAIVQAISAVFDLRGKNLARALSDLLKQIDSGFSAPAKTDATGHATKPWLNKIRDRQLSNLKPTITQKIEKESAASQ